MQQIKKVRGVQNLPHMWGDVSITVDKFLFSPHVGVVGHNTDRCIIMIQDT